MKFVFWFGGGVACRYCVFRPLTTRLGRDMKLDLIWLLCPLVFYAGWVGEAFSADRHAGYYYPEPKQIETYEARARVLPDASISRRIGFVTAITIENNQRPYSPSAVFLRKESRRKN